VATRGRKEEGEGVHKRRGGAKKNGGRTKIFMSVSEHNVGLRAQILFTVVLSD
jgi:hypothetical protein